MSDRLKKTEAASSGRRLWRQEGASASPVDLDKMRLAETPGHLMRRAQQRAVELYWQAVGEDGLRPPQFAAMITVYQNPGLNQTALVNLTGIDRSTIADMIPRLIKKGYLERKRTAEDQRAKRLWITPAGEALVRRDATAVDAAQNDILAPVPAEEKDRFLALLRLVADIPENGSEEA